MKSSALKDPDPDLDPPSLDDDDVASLPLRSSVTTRTKTGTDGFDRVSDSKLNLPTFVILRRIDFDLATELVVVVAVCKSP